MKIIQILCLLFVTNCSLQAQTNNDSSEKLIYANADASSRVTDNSTLDFYTNAPLELRTLIIPLNTQFTATVNLVGGRAFLTVRSIKIGDTVHTVDWRAFGADNKEGIAIVEAEQSLEVHQDQRLIFRDFSK